MKRLLLICFIFSASISFAQQFADKKFYLIDSLDLSTVSEHDKVIIDSCLTIFHNSKVDTIKSIAINSIMEFAWDFSLANRYNLWSYNYLKNLTRKIPQNNPSFKPLTIAYCITLNNIGYQNDMSGNTEFALKYYFEALKIQKSIKDQKGIGMTYNNIGGIYENQGKIADAISYYQKSLKIFEELKSDKEIGYNLNNIGGIYKEQEDYEIALKFLRKSSVSFTKVNYKRGMAMAHNNIGGVYENLLNLDSAYIYYNSCLQLCTEIDEFVGIGYANINLASIHKKRKEYKKAVECLEKSVNFFEKAESTQGMSDALIGITKLYLYHFNDYKKALKTANKALILAQEIGYPDLIQQSASLLSVAAEKNKDYELAFKMRNLEIVMKDSLNSLNSIKATASMNAKYEYEKKKAVDDAQNEKKIAIEKEKQEKQFLILIFTIVSTSLISILLIVIYRRLQITKKQKLIIEEQKELLSETNEELNQTNEEILAQRDQIEQQKHKIEEAHNEVKASINYAERIQKALLDNKEHWDSISEHFILFRPRDVVSGDFYWAYSFQNTNDVTLSLSKGDNNAVFRQAQHDIVIWAAADCTGHGVPGAFMSMLGVSFLNEIVADGGETNPGRILDKLRAKIIKALEQKSSEDERKDGMDIALCVWNKTTNMLQFAGANNPLVIIRKNSVTQSSQNEDSGVLDSSARTPPLNDDIIEIKPDKMPIGKHILDEKPFTTHEIQLLKGDTIYTFTDGYQDQFGGPEEKKYMVKRLKQYLAGLKETPISQQKALLNQEFEQWLEVGKTEQIDDVCVVGVKV